MDVGIIGSGNLASQLTEALSRSGFTPLFIHSRNQKTGKALSRKSGAPFLKAVPPAVNPKNSVLLLCVSDDAIDSCMSQYQSLGYTLIHHSGMKSLPDLRKINCGCAVLWPVQTLSTQLKPDWKKVPLCIEASDKESLSKVRKIARILGGPIYLLDSDARALAHLAAVFSNNFVNAQFSIAEAILKPKKIPFELLLPLIRQTVAGVKKSGNRERQTGPARRGDLKSIRHQEKMLESEPELKKVYKAISAYLLKDFGHSS